MLLYIDTHTVHTYGTIQAIFNMLNIHIRTNNVTYTQRTYYYT